MVNRRTVLSCAAVAAAIVFTGMNAWSQTTVPRNRTLIVAGQVEAPVYRNVGLANPSSINNEDYRVSIINMFEPLFYYNSNKNQVIPWLATGFDYAADFSAVTVKMRNGPTWSDGKPFTVDDVIFTLQMLIANGKGKKDLLNGAGLAAAELLSDYLDTRVSVEAGKGKGKIVIEFAGSEDLQRIVDLIEG